MIKFEEKVLIARLSRVLAQSRVMFSLCCATRQLAAWEEYAGRFCPDNEDTFRNVVEKIWDALASNVVPLNCAPMLQEVEALFPAEQNEWSAAHGYAEEAVASLAYTISCLIDGSEQKATWGARRAYTAADQAAIRQLGIQPGGAAEKKILMYPFVQRELERQERDLQILERHPFKEALDQLRLSALSEQTLALNEMKD
jgi:uncharacterized protein YjaG (DUF416 family)